jgi:hypothetical protein
MKRRWFLAFGLLASAKNIFALSVIWWNVGGANFLPERKKAFYSTDKLNKSLEEIIKELNPDLIFLGEYKDDFIPSLNAQYPYIANFPYNTNVLCPLSIAVYSKEKFEADYNINALTLGTDGSLLSEYKIDPCAVRSFVSIKLIKNHKNYELLPIHTVMPWHYLKDTGISAGVGILGDMEVGYEILFGKENALYKQLQTFMDLYQRKKEATKISKYAHYNSTIFGDFNTPEESVHVQSAPFDLLKTIFVPAKRESDSQIYSYPVPGTAESGVPSMQIDHVLSDKKNQGGEAASYRILFKEGSDHFPVYMEL